METRVMLERGQTNDGVLRRSLMRATEAQRRAYLRQHPDAAQLFPEFRIHDGMDGLTWSAVQLVTRQIQSMSDDARLRFFQTDPLAARHFPHLDPRNGRRQYRGPRLPLAREIIVVCLRRWSPESVTQYFHQNPWLRPLYPEFQPPGGWPPRLFMPLRHMEMGPNEPIQGPPERYEHWPIQDPFYDLEPKNYVQSRRTAAPLQPLLVLPPVQPRRTRSADHLRMPSPPRVKQMSPPRERTPSPRIRGQVFRRSPPRWDHRELEHIDTNFTLPPPRHGPEQYFDPARYRRGDPPSGYIGGFPPPPIYHDFNSEGFEIEDIIHRHRNTTGPVYPPRDPRDEVDYNRPQTRDYPMRQPFDMVWDDNFTPAEDTSQAAQEPRR